MRRASSKGVATFDAIGQGGGQAFATDVASCGLIPGGVGNDASTFSTTGFSLGLNTSDPAGINHFGFWLSALDSGNTLTSSRAGTTVFTFSPGDVLALVGGNGADFGNPNASFLGQNGGQSYVFLNFFDTNGAFDTVSFSEKPTIGG